MSHSYNTVVLQQFPTGLVTEFLDDRWQEVGDGCEASGGCQVDGCLHVELPVIDCHVNVLPLDGSASVDRLPVAMCNGNSLLRASEARTLSRTVWESVETE